MLPEEDDIKPIVNQAETIATLREISTKLCKVLTHARNPIYGINLTEAQVSTLADAEEMVYSVLRSTGSA